MRPSLSTFKSIINEMEKIRLQKLRQVYLPAFDGLDSTEKLELGRSGKVWWDYSKLEERKISASPMAITKIIQVENLSRELINLNPCENANSSVWEVFREVFTHHSTAIEGNRLSLQDTKNVINVFVEDIAQGLGFAEIDANRVAHLNLSPSDVVEVVNHAAAMEYLKNNFLGQSLSIERIQSLYAILMPSDSTSFLSMSDLSDTHGNYRRYPIKVRGSPTIRPYPHEVPILLEKLLELHHTHLKLHHPMIADILFMMNFLFIHPFPDGNGRLSRLLLLWNLFNHGYSGFLIPKQDKQRFFSYFTPYYEENNSDVVVNYVLDRIQQFHIDLKNYKQGKNQFR